MNQSQENANKKKRENARKLQRIKEKCEEDARKHKKISKNQGKLMKNLRD